MCSFGKEGICLMQLCLFIVQRADFKVSRAHAANYRDGPMYMYNGSVGVVCPTHILAKREVRPTPPRTPLTTPPTQPKVQDMILIWYNMITLRYTISVATIWNGYVQHDICYSL